MLIPYFSLFVDCAAVDTLFILRNFFPLQHSVRFFCSLSGFLSVLPIFICSFLHFIFVCAYVYHAQTISNLPFPSLTPQFSPSCVRVLKNPMRSSDKPDREMRQKQNNNNIMSEKMKKKKIQMKKVSAYKFGRDEVFPSVCLWCLMCHCRHFTSTRALSNDREEI